MIKVLVVEDNEALLEHLCILLEKAEFQVICYSDAPSTTDIISMEPDLVVFDIFLPTGNGLELARKLRDHHFQSKIVITSTDSQVLYECGEDVADAVLPKPFSGVQLTRLISELAIA